MGRNLQVAERDTVGTVGHGQLFLVFEVEESRQKLDLDVMDVENAGSLQSTLDRLFEMVPAGGKVAAAVVEEG